MDSGTLKKLEYDKILQRLAGFCSFALSREQAEQLVPVTDAYEAGQLQKETDEARELLRLYPTFSLGGLWDIRPYLQHLQIGGILDAEGLLRLAAMFRAARLAKSFFSEIKGSFPVLTSLGRGLTVGKTLESAVEKAIGEDGTIQDRASEALYNLRRRRQLTGQRIKDRLDNLIHNPNTAKFLQDPIVTIRANRYVVPVKQEYRGQIAGVAHDQSASGATVFIEPLAVMELNNELTAISREEEAEIAAIFRALSQLAYGFSQEMTANLNRLAALDFILAKGKLSYEMDGVAPYIGADGPLFLRQARHPLIPAARVVPIDLRLDKQISAMVITGPNTGGKTVALKTVGLLTLMGLSGLHIPADAGSQLRSFRQVFADIGDEQSIEQNLSTFSSHMTNIVSILSQGDENSLVLLDELCAGTDPTEGAALAMSILKYLAGQGAKVVATTHYSELKAFAYNNPGFINASVEFDLATLSPTYRLQMGVPGKSNAFEISRRLGLSEHIIEEAAGHLSSEDVAVAAMLADLETLRRQTAEEKEAARIAGEAVRRREEQLAREEQKLQIKSNAILRKANLQAQKIVDETREKSRQLYRQTQEKLEKDKAAERAWQEAQKKLKDWRSQLEEEIPEPVFAGEAPKSVKKGDYVFLPKLNQYGYVAAPPDQNGDLLLQVGVIKLKAALKDIRLADENKTKKNKGKSWGGAIGARKARGVEAELNLHGMDSLEAVHLLDKYIDDAFIAGLKQVRINHGRGTGALKAAVHEYLRTHRLVKSYRLAELAEGGPGVTLVDLDQ